MAVDPIDHAYSLAAAVLGDFEQAEDVASDAARRGGRSRIDVLAHARDLVAHAQPPPPGPEVPLDLTSLARALSRCRPVEERVVVDLDARHGLDRAQLGRVLGVPPAEAAAQAAEVADLWRETLDPALFAYLNPECLALDPEPESVPALLGSVPAVADHLATCETCADRARAMVSVRDLVAAAPLERAPARIRFAARGNRFRRSAPIPGAAHSSRGTWLWRIAVTAVVVVVGSAVVAAVEDDGEDALETPAANALRAFPPLLTRTPLPPVELRNSSEATIRWRSEPDVPWVVVSPRRGRLGAGASERIQLSLSDEAPEGDISAGVAFIGSDGATGLVRIDVAVERPPDVAATAEGCRVTATVEDESEVARVVLVERVGGVERETVMTGREEGYSGRLTRGGSEWWVTAVDARGNQASTPPSPSDCPA